MGEREGRGWTGVRVRVGPGGLGGGEPGERSLVSMLVCMLVVHTHVYPPSSSSSSSSVLLFPFSQQSSICRFRFCHLEHR